MMLHCLNTNRRCDMGFARARPTYEHDIVGTIHELAAIKLPHQGLVDLTVGKIKARKILIGGESG